MAKCQCARRGTTYLPQNLETVICLTLTFDELVLSHVFTSYSRNLLLRSSPARFLQASPLSCLRMAAAGSEAYSGYDEKTAASYLCGDLAEETSLPRDLLLRFHQMWHSHERPFFTQVAEDDTLGVGELAEVVRSIGVKCEFVCASISRVIADGSTRITFAKFVRGYAALHSRTLKQALPFAFKVFDMDGDGVLGAEEFAQILEANLTLQELDPSAIKRVLAAPEALRADGDDGPLKLTLRQFRYFGSISSETILAACGFMLHVRDFYVPLAPFDEEDEELEKQALTTAHARAPAPDTAHTADTRARACFSTRVCSRASTRRICFECVALRWIPCITRRPFL